MVESRYKAVRRIAIGGMAEVLLASQQSLGGFERLVVIKRILPNLRDDPEFIQMFLDEARLVATLHHQNIVEILDVYREGEDLQVAMEYLFGEDLRNVIGRIRKREVSMPVGVACRIVADVAAALDYAHAAADMEGHPLQIVHRDIGPSNIIVGYGGVAKLIDFGIAKASISHIYTRPGTLKGKFAYMSPEQIKHQELDGRTDLFSLSIVLYEMLTARRLFHGASEAAVLQSVMERVIPPPSQLNPAVPPELDRIVLAGLERDRERRTPRAGDLHDALERLLGTRLPATSTKQVGEWMVSALADRHQQRLAMEREVIQISREPEPLALPDPSLPPLFMPGSSATSAPSASGRGTSSQSLPPPASSQAKPGRPWLVALLGALGALALMALIIGLLFGLNRGPQPAPRVPGPKLTTLVVHALPPGGELKVNGQPEERPVGPEGLIVTRPAGTKLALELSKAGYLDHRSELTMPSSGTQHVNLYLTALPSEPAATAATAPAAAREASTAVAPTARFAPAGRRSRVGQRGAPGPLASKTPPAALATGSLVVAFSPPSATVQLDGQALAGSSPLRAAGIRAGSHSLLVSAPGHEPLSRSVTITPAAEAMLDLRLTRQAPLVGRVDVVTDPTGASVQVDGTPRGRSPLVGLQLAAQRTHRIEISLAGYRTWSTQITPSAGANPTVVATLSRLAPGLSAGAQEADVTVPQALAGSVQKGRALFQSKCASQCHSAPVAPRKYTAEQWSRYFAYGRHRVPLKASFSRSSLADVKSYLMSVAADVERDTAAGIR
jgi:serine/threonine-protein kinase